MSKVDLDKFIVDYVKYSNIQEALKQQGLKCSGDEIVEISQVNEDERIRKELIAFIKKRDRSGCDYDYDKWIAWLEKQCEKSSICERYDKIKDSELFKKTHEGMTVSEEEPKFHEGDWIVYKNEVCQLVKREEGCNKLVTVFGIEKELVNERNLSTARLWTIGDAKEGDILANKANDAILIFKTIQNNYLFSSYCDYFVNTFREKQFSQWASSAFIPATKEQRDYLFVKMRESGYEWDKDKKELMKIEDKIEIPFSAKDSELQEVTYYIPKDFHAEIDDDKVVIKKSGKPIAWSEEDEEMVKDIIAAIDTLYYHGMVNWLKSLKDRVQPQNKWKPSKEQIIALRWVLNNIPYNIHKEEISGLLDQIKDL